MKAKLISADGLQTFTTIGHFTFVIRRPVWTKVKFLNISQDPTIGYDDCRVREYEFHYVDGDKCYVYREVT